MSDLSLALECLAVGAHFASGQTSGYGTTSACYFSTNNTLYVTSQATNQTFFSIPMLPEANYQKSLEALQAWDSANQVTKDMRGFKAIVTPSKHASADEMSLKKKHTSLSMTWAVHCFNAGCKVMDEKRYDELSSALFLPNPSLKIVMDSDIFSTGVSAHTGFHGESRLLRYMFIKLLRKQIKGTQLNQPALDTTKMVSEFAALVKGKLFMGSNRPACADCANFMTQVGVDFESRRKTASKSGNDWIHPFYLDQNADTISPVAKAQAARMVAT